MLVKVRLMGRINLPGVDCTDLSEMPPQSLLDLMDNVSVELDCGDETVFIAPEKKI